MWAADDSGIGIVAILLMRSGYSRTGRQPFQFLAMSASHQRPRRSTLGALAGDLLRAHGCGQHGTRAGWLTAAFAGLSCRVYSHKPGGRLAGPRSSVRAHGIAARGAVDITFRSTRSSAERGRVNLAVGLTGYINRNCLHTASPERASRLAVASMGPADDLPWIGPILFQPAGSIASPSRSCLVVVVSLRRRCFARVGLRTRRGWANIRWRRSQVMVLQRYTD